MKAGTHSPILGIDGKPLRRAATSQSLRARYDAAQTTANNRKHWAAADQFSARESNSPHVRATLRSRSRYECHESNSFASGMVSTLANDTIGRGPRLQIEIENTAVKKQIETRWWHWARRCNLAAKLQTAHKALVVDGEAFISSSTNPRSRDDVKLDVMLTECDQIAAPWGIGDYFEDENYVDGIKLDKFGNAMIYHRLKGHPGDPFAILANEKDDIAAEDMIHLVRRDRPGQYRGVPWLTTALPLFAILRRYTLAVLAAAESVASFGGVIYTDSPQVSPAGVDPMDEIELELRSFLTLPEGWKMGQLKAEQPTTVYEMFRNAILMEIARCINMPLGKALGNHGGYNYASGRMDNQIYHQMIKVMRHMYEVECIDRIFDWWLDEALLVPGYLTDIPSMEFVEHAWIWDEPEHVDPSKVATATSILWNLGLLSDEEYQQSRGVDPEEHDMRIARQMKRRKELGLPLPGGVGTAVVASNSDKPDDDDTEETETDDVEEEADV